MRPNDDTIYQPSKEQDSKKEESPKKENLSGWQKVTIGGFTGILMGAASMYAANAYGKDANGDEETGNQANHTTENGLRVADVDESQSFGEAFAQAREAVGPGGVFHWHGGIYNTYTESEWNNMSPSERSDFARQVSPEIHDGEGDPNHYTAHNQEHHNNHDDHVHRSNDGGHHDEDQNSYHNRSNTHNVSDDEEQEPEVHILGVERMQTDDGSYINVGRARIADQDVAVVDIDDDMIFDVRISDSNNNGVLEDDEIVDISDAQISVTDFAAAAMQQNEGMEQSDQIAQANFEQDDLAPDMPDYMNDADISTV